MIYDEVMTGFRVALGSAQSLYAQQIEGFQPDITVMGKVISGGMPLAAFGGRREIMEKLSPPPADVPGRHALGQPNCHRHRSPQNAGQSASPAHAELHLARPGSCRA